MERVGVRAGVNLRNFEAWRGPRRDRMEHHASPKVTERAQKTAGRGQKGTRLPASTIPREARPYRVNGQPRERLCWRVHKSPLPEEETRSDSSGIRTRNPEAVRRMRYQLSHTRCTFVWVYFFTFVLNTEWYSKMVWDCNIIVLIIQH